MSLSQQIYHKNFIADVDRNREKLYSKVNNLDLSYFKVNGNLIQMHV